MASSSKPPLRRVASPPPSRAPMKVCHEVPRASPGTESGQQPRSGSEDNPSSPAWPSNDLPQKSKAQAADDDSETEEEPEEDYTALNAKGNTAERRKSNAATRQNTPGRSVPSKRATPDQPARGGSPASPDPARPVTSSSPLPAPKKSKRAKAPSSSSDDDSEEERKRHLSRIKAGGSRGAKQPLKRGGKRF